MAGRSVLIGFAKMAETVGADTAWIIRGIFEGLATLIEEAAEVTAVGKGSVLGFPVISRLVTTVPVVMGGSLGVGKACVPMESTSFGFAAGATAEAGAAVTNVKGKEARRRICRIILPYSPRTCEASQGIELKNDVVARPRR